jgi:hypothetical protein
MNLTCICITWKWESKKTGIVHIAKDKRRKGCIVGNEIIEPV